ncbi:expressed unknown protein [Seminavis robusta]|uniref:Uncharacterized protein n=1 Tax=Seminavis robusta TaxID=568900 RepID=A0A9N8HQP4_9STRA|nr:expressed unknown protein [Seminavis robusta]|eukprot:Sro1184_g250190.1 n/a (345) ;mRNA; r:33774-34808
MASFLVAQNVVEPRISTIEEALLSSTPLCVQRGSVMDDLLSDKYPDLKLVRKDTEQGMFEGLGLGWYNGKGGCGALLTNLGTYDIYQGQEATNSDCTLGSDKRLILNLPAGFATAVDSAIQCTSLISYVLDVHLQEMQQEGFIQEAWQRHVAKISEVTCGPETNTGGSSGGGGEDANSDGSFSLDMKAMGGIFLNHFVMSVAALGLAFCQRMYTKYNKPERKMRPIKVDEAVHNIVETVDESLKTVAETVDVSMRSMKEGIDGTVRVAKDTMDGSMRHVTRALDESTRNVMQSVDGSMRNMVQTVDGSMRSMTGSMRRVSRPSTRSFRWDASSYDDDANQENSD